MQARRGLKHVSVAQQTAGCTSYGAHQCCLLGTSGKCTHHVPIPTGQCMLALWLQVVHKAALLPALRDGDWLMFPFAGAYTICAASNYGGVRFTQPLKLFIYSDSAHRDTCGFDMAAGMAAAAAWNHGSDGSCCGSDVDSSCAVTAIISNCVDSDNGSNSGDGAGKCDAGSTMDIASLDGCAGAAECVVCGAGGCQDVQHSYPSCVCGQGDAAVDDGCMSVASEGTAGPGVTLEGCDYSQLDADVTSMAVA